MSSVIKVDTIQSAAGSTILGQTNSTTITLGVSGQTITVPSGATLTNNGTATGFGGGKLLQLTHGTLGTAVVRTGSGAAATGLITSITPASTSNKIFLSINIGGIRPQANTYLELWIYRQINGGGYSNLRKMENGLGYISSELQTWSKSQFYLDTTHNTTSQIDYQIYMGYQGSGSQVAINNDQQEWSTITAMEIEA